MKISDQLSKITRERKNAAIEDLKKQYGITKPGEVAKVWLEKDPKLWLLLERDAVTAECIERVFEEAWKSLMREDNWYNGGKGGCRWSAMEEHIIRHFGLEVMDSDESMRYNASKAIMEIASSAGKVFSESDRKEVTDFSFLLCDQARSLAEMDAAMGRRIQIVLDFSNFSVANGVPNDYLVRNCPILSSAFFVDAEKALRCDKDAEENDGDDFFSRKFREFAAKEPLRNRVLGDRKELYGWYARRVAGEALLAASDIYAATFNQLVKGKKVKDWLVDYDEDKREFDYSC